MNLGRTSTFSFLIALFILLPLTFAAAQSFGRTSQYRDKISALGAAPIAGFPIPVLLGVEVSDLTKNFGDPRGDGTRTHEGLDILAPSGTPVVSPTDAVVTRVGDGASSGIYVRTANPGGETFVYMHLSSVASGVSAGDTVTRGEVIGFVGNTGNASGGPAHLHFEVRKNGATDPYPRLTEVFTLEERMRGVAQALDRGGVAYVATYASRFSAIFTAAKDAGLAIPNQILALLGTSVAVAATDSPQVTLVGVDGPLVFGETNGKVVELQKFLIASASGEAGARLARTGATGYFGSLTQAALLEYQQSAGLVASGVVDDDTYTQIFALSGEGDSSETIPEDERGEEGTPVSDASLSSLFVRDLELGMKGEDVRALQVFLNNHNFLVAESAEGSPGKETTYFGSLTQAALARYQAANDIAPAVGYFGPITRKYLLGTTG